MSRRHAPQCHRPRQLDRLAIFLPRSRSGAELTESGPGSRAGATRSPTSTQVARSCRAAPRDRRLGRSRRHSTSLALQRGSGRFESARVSRIRRADAPDEGTPANARECPRMTGGYFTDNTNTRVAGISAKPSDGLEPSTPSLPSWNRAGMHGHGRVTAATKAPQTSGTRRRLLARVWTLVDALMFASRSHAMSTASTTRMTEAF